MNKQLARDIADRLRSARIAARLTQEEVALDFLLSRQAVSSWERGQSLPSATQLYEIGILYGVSLDYLLYGIRSMPMTQSKSVIAALSALPIV